MLQKSLGSISAFLLGFGIPPLCRGSERQLSLKSGSVVIELRNSLQNENYTDSLNIGKNLMILQYFRSFKGHTNLLFRKRSRSRVVFPFERQSTRFVNLLMIKIKADKTEVEITVILYLPLKVKSKFHPRKSASGIIVMKVNSSVIRSLNRNEI